MASRPGSSSTGGLTSAFDDMLRENRSRLDGQWDETLQGAGLPSTGRDPAPLPAAGHPPPRAEPTGRLTGAGPRTPLRRSGDYVSAARVWDAAKSESAAVLNERYSDAWEFEVASHSREGDEFVVLGKLSLPSRNLVKSNFGRGHIPGTASDTTAASAGGIAFRFGEGEAAAGGSQSAEDRGYRRAIENALARCLALL